MQVEKAAIEVPSDSEEIHVTDDDDDAVGRHDDSSVDDRVKVIDYSKLKYKIVAKDFQVRRVGAICNE